MFAIGGGAFASLVLLASVLIFPAFTTASLEGWTCQPVAEGSVRLYSRGQASVYLTGRDILRPDLFALPEEPIDAVILDYDVDPPPSKTPSWNQQVLFALRLQAHDGKRIEPSVALTDTDAALRRQWGSLFPLMKNIPGAKTLKSGETFVFALPADSGLRKRTSLRAIVPVGISQGKDAQGANIALALAAMPAPPDGRIDRIAISYTHLASEKNSASDIRMNFEALLSAADRMAMSKTFRTVVIGTWSKVPAQAARLADGFCEAWRLFEGKLTEQAATPAHGPLRLTCVALIAAFTGALLRREPMTLMRAVAFYLAIGAALATFSGLLMLVFPIADQLVSPTTWIAMQFAVAALCGWYLPKLLRFNATEQARSGAAP